MEFIIGYLLADILSGVGHWFEDTVLTPENTTFWPALHQISLDNQEHHKNPKRMTTSKWQDTISTTLPFVLFLGIVLFLNFGFQVWWLSTLTLLLFTNQIHKWQHMTINERPSLAGWLMYFKIIASSSHHLKHHKKPFDKNFCIITPHVNNVINLFYYFGLNRFWIAAPIA